MKRLDNTQDFNYSWNPVTKTTANSENIPGNRVVLEIHAQVELFH